MTVTILVIIILINVSMIIIQLVIKTPRNFYYNTIYVAMKKY